MVAPPQIVRVPSSVWFAVKTGILTALAGMKASLFPGNLLWSQLFLSLKSVLISPCHIYVEFEVVKVQFVLLPLSMPSVSVIGVIALLSITPVKETFASAASTSHCSPGFVLSRKLSKIVNVPLTVCRFPASDIEDYGAGDDYYNLVFEGTGITYTDIADITVANDLTVASGTFDMGANNLTVGNNIIIDAAGKITGGSGTLTAGGNVTGLGTLVGQTSTVDINGSMSVNNYNATTGTTNVAGDWNVGSYTHNSGTVVFDGSGSTAAETFFDLQITTGTRTAAGSLSIENDLSIGSGAVLTLGTGNLTVTGNVSGAGTLEGGSVTVDIGGDMGTPGVPIGSYTVITGTTYAGGNWNISGTFDPGAGSVVFDNAGTLSVNETFYNLTIQAGASFDTQGNSVWISGAVENQGTLYRRGGDYVSQTDANSGTVVYRTAAGSIQSYIGDDYYNLTVDQAAATFTLTGITDINGDLTITAGTLDADNYDITVGGSWSNSVGTAGFTYGTGTVYFDDAGERESSCSLVDS